MTDDVYEKIYKIIVKQNKQIKTLLIIDDAAAEKATNSGNKGSLSRLALACPHLNLSIVGIFQRITAASPALRDNTEALISFYPSKMLDIKTIVEEFNPMPADIDSVKITKDALQRGWADSSKFVFIFRPPRVGQVLYFNAFDKEIQFRHISIIESDRKNKRDTTRKSKLVQHVEFKELIQRDVGPETNLSNSHQHTIGDNQI